jgi:CMP-N,N'-diacetyllegionaminic acid synthase
MKILYVIPARGGSKGIPHKNIKMLAGKPLICYTIDLAKALAIDEDICVSTDDDVIIKTVEDYGLKVPFIRPQTLSTDEATSNDVLIHAVQFYESLGRKYDVVVLLQPTSPLRKPEQIKEAIDLYRADLDMVVSVKKSHTASVLCQENEDGYLEFTINKNGERRQEIPTYYEFNGAIYVINIQSLKRKGLSRFDRKQKYVMPDESSIDLDTNFDWILAELLLGKKPDN